MNSTFPIIRLNGYLLFSDKIKVQVPGIWAKRCVLGDCVGVFCLDMMDGESHGIFIIIVQQNKSYD